MINLEGLSWNEKVFLAGCIKAMILSDGRIGDEEVGDVDRIVGSYRFRDYEMALQEYENEMDRQADFWDLARHVERPESREMILSVLNEVSLREGYMDRSQSNLLSELESMWRLDSKE